MFRDNNGAWVGGLTKFKGICEVVIVELWGVYEGLNLAREKCHRKAELHIDNQEVCNDLTIATSKLKYG